MSIDRSKRKIIIDTDPGQDDAIAILFALAASDRLDLRAITTVAGNVPLDFTSRNARIVLDWRDGRKFRFAVETQSDLTLGETVVDWEALTQRAPIALWIDDVDPDGFFSLLTETVAKLP